MLCSSLWVEPYNCARLGERRLHRAGRHALSQQLAQQPARHRLGAIVAGPVLQAALHHCVWPAPTRHGARCTPHPQAWSQHSTVMQVLCSKQPGRCGTPTQQLGSEDAASVSCIRWARGEVQHEVHWCQAVCLALCTIGRQNRLSTVLTQKVQPAPEAPPMQCMEALRWTIARFVRIAEAPGCLALQGAV